jgi:hypothetical protein
MKKAELMGIASLVLAALCSGCDRRVVIDPSLVPSRNQSDWTIQSTPAAAAPATAAPATAAPASAPPPATPSDQAKER